MADRKITLRQWVQNEVTLTIPDVEVWEDAYDVAEEYMMSQGWIDWVRADEERIEVVEDKVL